VARELVEERDVDIDAPAPDNDVEILAAEPPSREPIPESCPLVATVFWDSGERYLSTDLFDPP
jgi:cysteine synthase A